MSCSKVFDLHRYRTFFAERWGNFLKANYASPEEVSVAYGVRFQTALNWWQGTNQPSGYAVALGQQMHPESFAECMERAA